MARARQNRFLTETRRDYSPIATINTTPLIDMMLVILIMLIVCIPLSTHKVDVDLPSAPTTLREPPPVHMLAIDAGGAIAWDGQALDMAALPARLAALNADPAAPVLHFAAAGEARYERVDQVLGEVRRAGVSRLGFVGNSEFAATLDR